MAKKRPKTSIPFFPLRVRKPISIERNQELLRIARDYEIDEVHLANQEAICRGFRTKVEKIPPWVLRRSTHSLRDWIIAQKKLAQSKKA